MNHEDENILTIKIQQVCLFDNYLGLCARGFNPIDAPRAAQGPTHDRVFISMYGKHVNSLKFNKKRHQINRTNIKYQNKVNTMSIRWMQLHLLAKESFL